MGLSLFLDKFLKQTHQHTGEYTRLYLSSLLFYHWLLNLWQHFFIFKNVQVSQDHETMAQVLFSRNLRLNVALTFWRRRSISELVAYLVR